MEMYIVTFLTQFMQDLSKYGKIENFFGINKDPTVYFQTTRHKS